MEFLLYGLYPCMIVAILVVVIIAIRLLVFAIAPNYFPKLVNTCLYVGRVKHTRLKGGAHHHLDYPIFFVNLDLRELSLIGWSLWPIFRVNSPYWAFCSFVERDHLKDISGSENFAQKLQNFLNLKSANVLTNRKNIQLLTHLTYFGYCFNPISIYYIWKNDANDLEAVIAEVSNTPWLEMHSYLLHETVEECTIFHHPNKETFRATWKKQFHVSPFMEMDYDYDFTFFVPTDNILKVSSKMLKQGSKETWFTANFELSRIEFTPFNLLYVLTAYPLQTRLIQVYIHFEALKLFLKGLPFFDHPNGTDVHFGFGISGSTFTGAYEYITKPFKHGGKEL